ncbi:MAG: hypothetical protein H7144_00265 [Burkholderiales bacterium]|nr:hypothetical protein [Phycisphaerae bacterium]
MAESKGMSEGELAEPLTSPRSAVTWRSILLGLAIAIFIAVITPYNDYVVWNSFIVGSYFPPIATISMLAIVLLINGPLHKFAPRFAMSPGELSIVLAMALISCSIPSQGLLRQFAPLPVAPFNMTGTNPYHDLFLEMDLPKWLFAVDSLDTGHREMSVTKFYSRLAPDESIPWSMWMKPALSWGLFAAAFLTAMLSIACLVRFQWAVNERLPFPIAQLQSMLIAPPAPGRAFNSVFASKGFWIAAWLVIVVHGSNGLHAYFPNAVPAIPYQYDLTTTLTDDPWASLSAWPKKGTIFFTLLGVVYFTQTRVSFSLWMAPLLLVLIRWPLTAQGDTTLSDAAVHDQGLGASFAFIAGVIWIGRHHWMVIARALFGIGRPNDPQGAFVSYRSAAIGFILGTGGMFAWLWLLVGCAWWVSALSVLMILMAHVITARVVAETGLAYLRVPVNMDSIIKNLPVSWMRPRDAFFYGVSHYGLMQAARESTLVFAQTGLQVVDSVDPSEKDRRRTVPVLSATLIVALIAGFMASLYCYYNWVTPLDPVNNDGLLNVWGAKNWPQTWLNDFPTQVRNGAYPAKSQNSWLHMGIGLTLMMVLQALTWRFSAWPLMPVGYLMCSASTSFYVNNAALSLFLGWLFKTLILRFGGAKLFNDLKPVFIGFIFGEALSTGIWLIVTLVLAMHGDQFYVVKFLPQ